MITAYEADNIKIIYIDFASSVTVVTFAAKGLPSGPVPENEYHRQLFSINNDENINDRFNVITVIDLDRSFYMNGRMKIVIDKINHLITILQSKRNITMGLSMGGFAAVVFAKHLNNCNKVIAFGAHSAVHPSIVPFDDRSPELRAKISVWDVMDCLDEISDLSSYHLIYGDFDPNDMLHAARFASLGRSNIHIRILQNCEHNVVDVWTRNGVIQQALLSLLRH